MPSLADYARQSPYSDPGAHAAALTACPADLAGLSAVVRNLLVHYRGGGIPLSGARLAEIDNRWVERILDTDRSRNASPLEHPRPVTGRVAGCCRDFTLLTVAALRQHGVPARSRVGFAAYLGGGYWYDHVIVELWDGQRWRFADAQLDPAHDWGFDPLDMPLAVGTATPRLFASAAQVWTAYRRGDTDASRYGVDPEIPIGGPWFIRNYVIGELAHRQREELLLWDGWGAMRASLDGADLELVDGIAALLLAADDGDAAAEDELARRYAADDRLHPGGRVVCLSPAGRRYAVDLVTRAESEPDGGLTIDVAGLVQAAGSVDGV